MILVSLLSALSNSLTLSHEILSMSSGLPIYFFVGKICNIFYMSNPSFFFHWVTLGTINMFLYTLLLWVCNEEWQSSIFSSFNLCRDGLHDRRSKYKHVVQSLKLAMGPQSVLVLYWQCLVQECDELFPRLLHAYKGCTLISIVGLQWLQYSFFSSLF